MPYYRYGTVKSRPGLRRHRTSKREGGKRVSLLLVRTGLASYLYRPYTPCVNPSMLGVVSTPPQWVPSPDPNCGVLCSGWKSSSREGLLQLVPSVSLATDRVHNESWKQLTTRTDEE